MLSNQDTEKMPVDAKTEGTNTREWKSELQGISSSPNLPAFWNKNPGLWFKQAELTMESLRMTKDETKFLYIVRSLDQNLCQRVADIIMNPPPTNKYTSLKDLLIKRTEDSEMKRLETLFQTVEMGNQSPSSFYSQLIQIAGGVSCVPEGLIRKLWISRLPPTIAAILMAGDTDDFNKMLDSADNIWGIRNPSTNPFCGSMNHLQQSTSNADWLFNFENLKSSINEIRSRLDRFESNHNPRNRFNLRPRFSKSRSQTRSRHRSQTPGRSYVCWYHLKYKNNAHKCKGGSCVYKNQIVHSRQPKTEN